jgi:hypothetical protein
VSKPKPERGQYRSITVVLLDGPDFQELPPEARWVFTVLKISMGPCGIEVWYPDALVAVLAARTGHSPQVVGDMLDVLQATGWIRAERNVVWIVKQLRFEPAMSHNNELHRVAVAAHLKGLPRLAIVGDFIRLYQSYLPQWEELAKEYPQPSKGVAIAYGKGSEGVANHRDRDRIPNTETETEEVTTTSADAERKEASHNNNSCMKLIVDRLYLGNRPAPDVMAANGSILRNFAKVHGFDRMARIIEGLALRRDRGELHKVGSREAVSLKWLNSANMDLNQLAVSEDALYRSEPSPRTGRGGSVGIADILGRTA